MMWGWARMPRLLTFTAASRIALACISVMSAARQASRQPGRQAGEETKAG